MSFLPLPEILLETVLELSEREDAAAVDLGCGDGQLTRTLSLEGLGPVGLDRRHPALGSAADVVGDALRPPLAPASLDLALAGNLVRHLLVQDPRGDFLRRWAELLRPGGRLLILEDQPDGGPAGRRNYRRLQEFLVELSGGRRGPLLSLDRFCEVTVQLDLPAPWRTGLKANRQTADVQAVLALLRGDGGPLAPPVQRLHDSIAAEGLDYGRYWWACWERPC